MDWRDMLAKWLREGMPSIRKRDRGKKRIVNLAPVTANGWISIVKVVCTAMTARYELARDPAARIEFFPVPRTYTREEPNALSIEQVPVFLAKMKALFPQHYAMTVLGFSIGARPSSLRPLRRRGTHADLLWPNERTKSGRVLLRRSHTRGNEIMDQTKTGVDLDIPLPTSTMEVLREHVESLDGFMEDSELLFPSITGGLRASSVLDKPFREVIAALGWNMRLTPRAMRRTFQDLMRHAHVADVVARAISGHATASMQRHYSTAQNDEMLSAVSNVVAIMLPAKPPSSTPDNDVKSA